MRSGSWREVTVPEGCSRKAFPSPYRAGQTSVREAIDLECIPVILYDTAGLRETIDGIETLGIERTRRAMSDSDLVLVVVDGSTGIGPSDRELIDQTENTRRLVVMNKS